MAAKETGDFGLTDIELKVKHGTEHPSYTKQDWRDDVANDDTSLGYWEWVLHNVESHYYDDCEHCGESAIDKVFAADVGYVCSECAAELEATAS